MAFRDQLIVFIAKGFGSGYAPKGPGTFGSIVGLLWFAILLSCNSLPIYLVACVAGILFSVWICGAAETIMQQHDPSSVVMDEIIALPLCFLPLVIKAQMSTGMLPDVKTVFIDNWWIPLIGFVLFRIFDIAKPGPIGKIQNLPGGLGVTADDVLAGFATSAVMAFLPL